MNRGLSLFLSTLFAVTGTAKAEDGIASHYGRSSGSKVACGGELKGVEAFGEARIDYRLRLLAFPMRAAVRSTPHSTTAARHETSQVPMRSLCT